MSIRGRIAFGFLAVAAIGGAILAELCSRPETAAGPCVVARGPVSLPDLPETSGLALGRRERGVIWSHNDSDNAAVLFALDAAGAVRGRVHVPIRIRDWEDVSAARCPAGDCLYIGDIGDNGLERRQVQILRVPEPAVSDRATARPARFPAVYSDGPHNAEAMFVVDDQVFIITKDRAGVLFRGRIPASGDRTIDMRPVAELGMPMVSDAEASPDGQVVVVRSPREAAFYRTADLASGKADAYMRIQLDGLGEPQGEGAAFDGTMLYLSSEGRPWTGGGLFMSLRCAVPTG